MATVRQKQALGVAAALVGAGVLTYIFTPDETLHRGALRTERRMAKLTQSRIRLQGVSISYLDGGHINAPTLILLHGFGATKETWVRVAKHLTPFYRVLIPDLPGFGESTKSPERNYSIAGQVRWLNAFVERMGIYPGFHLGGHSMGGYIAGMYASRFPRQVASLWMMAPLGVQDATQSEMFQIIEAGGQSPLVVHDMQEFEHRQNFIFHRQPWIPQPVLRTLAFKSIENVYLHREIFDTISEFHERRPRFMHPLEDLLHALDIPMLVTWGEQDRVLDVSGAITLQHNNPHTTVDLMSGVGHMPLMERPRQVAHQFKTWQLQH